MMIGVAAIQPIVTARTEPAYCHADTRPTARTLGAHRGVLGQAVRPRRPPSDSGAGSSRRLAPALDLGLPSSCLRARRAGCRVRTVACDSTRRASAGDAWSSVRKAAGLRDELQAVAALGSARHARWTDAARRRDGARGAGGVVCPLARILIVRRRFGQIQRDGFRTDRRRTSVCGYEACASSTFVRSR